MSEPADGHGPGDPRTAGAAPLTVLTHLPPGILGSVTRAHPSVSLVGVPEEGEPGPGVAGEVLLTQTWGSPNLAAVLARGVRWVHAYGTGVDGFPFELLAERPLTCSRGASAIPIAEFVLATMLAFEKDLPRTWIREASRWRRHGLGGLHGRTLGLVGLGGIGRAVAERALPFGMHVLALRRRAAPSPVPGVEITTDLGALVAASDHLVVAAPATPRTRHLLDREALGRVKPGVHLVNVARGDLVDPDALREALDDGRVALASLDVTEPEPPPEDHWLYRHERVRLSPHVSWAHPRALDWLAAPFVANLGRWLRGDPLEHVVDVREGY